MTICVPKKPFEVIGSGIIYCLTFSWIVTLPIAVLDIIGKLKVFDVGILLICGAFSFIFSLMIIIEANKEKHWIKWCDKKQKVGSVE